MLDDATKRSWAVTAVMAASVVFWSGCISTKMQVGVTKWSASWRSGGRVFDPAFPGDAQGVPSWGSGLKACGGGASSPWQKDPRPQLPISINRSRRRGTGYREEFQHDYKYLFASQLEMSSFPPKAPMLVDGGVDPIRRPQGSSGNPRIPGLTPCQVSTPQLRHVKATTVTTINTPTHQHTPSPSPPRGPARDRASVLSGHDRGLDHTEARPTPRTGPGGWCCCGGP